MDRHILVDCDGVLADFVTPVLALANNYSSRTWDASHLTRWDFLQDFVDLEAPSLLAKKVKWRIGLPRFCANLRPYPGAREGLDRLRAIGSVKIVTSPWASSTWCGERIEWLAHHFEVPAKDVIFASDKSLIHGGALIDDNPEAIEAWHRYQATHSTRPGIGVVWDHPHHWGGSHPTRASSWDELLRLLA